MKPPAVADSLDASGAPPKQMPGATTPGEGDPDTNIPVSIWGETEPPTAKSVPKPERETKQTGPVYMGSGFGALEPLFREAKEEGEAL